MADIVIKSSLTGNFTIITNEFARNPKVTPRAARVFIYLMSNSEGWTTSAARISKLLEMGESTVGAALRDLEALAYLVRERKNVDGGRFKWEYELYAHPITTDGKTSDGATSGNDTNPQVETSGWKTTDGLTTGGNPSDIRRPIPNKTKQEENQEEHSAPKGAPGRGKYSPEFEEFWKIYPRKGDKEKSQDKFNEQLQETDLATLMQAVTNFRTQVEAGDTPTKYLAMGKTWLGQGRWRDYLRAVNLPTTRTSREDVAGWDINWNDREQEGNNDAPF